ncbi:hypothetical protein NSK_007365 [Nannochloropsis salina CCMP1776]|uniref:THH1/TOM1/TOM3 domain-containing protein n=1 Tax=Nannochloropsis salina CCMP1776 TaxID=1027361 RepID=A0A4D9CS84_9STRA|nr:hypothetical protein NSK_007365 [Nannochloropsis salina CCMP1776]|eukprot:TFJ81404.1 hypothetical protein NSK_007365 [Nannochloropsis salina CCMP1776]
MLILDGLGVTPFILALLYLATTALISSRLRNLHTRHPEMNTTKLFVLSVLLSCGMRCLSFIALGAFSVQSIAIDNDASGRASSPSSSWSSTQDPDTQFYEKALLILFNLPDFVFVSAYVLLALVWAEAFIQSRSHWLSIKQFRRMWLLSYLVFNACLYLGQLVLYTLLFLPHGNQDFLSKIIFLTLCVINFSLPIILLLLFFYLSIMFAGFPYKSRRAPAKLNKISKVMAWWTIGRIIWGIVVLTSILQGWLSDAHKDRQVYSVVLVGLFLITELIPFFVAMDVSLLASLSTASAVGEEGREGGGEGGEGGTYGALLVPATLSEVEGRGEEAAEDTKEAGKRENGIGERVGGLRSVKEGEEDEEMGRRGPAQATGRGGGGEGGGERGRAGE